MKQKIFKILHIALVALVVTVAANAQATNSGSQNSNGGTISGSDPKKQGAGLPDHISARFLNNLFKKYKGATNKTWYETSYGFVVKFNIKNRHYRADYDKKGNWLYNICTYNENELSPDLSEILKSTYYKYNVSLVQEIEMPKNIFTYIVSLDGDKEQLQIRLKDGEMDEMQTLTKLKIENGYTSNNRK